MTIDITDVTDEAESPEPTPSDPAVPGVDWGELPAHRALADSNGLPRAVWSDGETAWVTDLSGRIFAYDLATMSPVADKRRVHPGFGGEPKRQRHLV